MKVFGTVKTPSVVESFSSARFDLEQAGFLCFQQIVTTLLFFKCNLSFVFHLYTKSVLMDFPSFFKILIQGVAMDKSRVRPPPGRHYVVVY